MRIFAELRLLFVHVRADVHLATDDGMDALADAGAVEVHHAVHHAVVGDGAGVHAQFLEPGNQGLDGTCAVQQAVFGMQMQVCKHAFPPYVRSCAAPKPRAASKTRRPRVPQSVRRRKILQARRFQMRPTPGSPRLFPALLPIRSPASPACAPTQESAPCSTGQAPSRSCAVALAAGTAGSRRFPPYALPRRSLPHALRGRLRRATAR